MCSISSSIQAKNGELFTVVLPLPLPSPLALPPSQGAFHSRLFDGNRPPHPARRAQRIVGAPPSFHSSYAISNSLLSETAAALIKSHRLLGRVQGGSFIPQHYENEKVV